MPDPPDHEMDPDQSLDFEPGYDPVARIVDRGRSEGRWKRAAVGIRTGRVRLELDGDRAFDFDDAGRLIVAQLEGRSFRATLDLRLVGTEVHAGEGPGRRRLRPLPPLRFPHRYLVQWYDLARSVQESSAGARRLRGEIPDPDRWVRQRLAPVARWTERRLQEELAAIRSLYRPIPVLPPDQYRSLVLQATEGCPWDRCSFCTFYQGVDHRVRSPREFLAHVDAVLAHLGASAARYRRVFLGQANALLAPNDVLEPMLEGLLERLPLVPDSLPPAERAAWRERHRLYIDGVFSFVDGFHRTKAVDELRRLRTLGLRRVYLGLESGSARVLELLRKPSSPERVIELATGLRAAGVALGVIVLVGAGGQEAAEEHEERTLALLADLRLEKGDQVYLSQLVQQEGADYGERAAAAGLSPLDAGQLRQQGERFRRSLRAFLPAGVPVAPYDIVRLGETTPRA